LNQFKLSNVPGETMSPNDPVISARISSSQSSYLVAGDCVTLVAAEDGDIPVVEKMTSPAVAEGVLLFNAQKAKRYAGERVEIALKGSIVTMVAATAINRGVSVAWSNSTGYVSSTSGLKLGHTLDIAAATGDIIRVYIDPSAT
jgi:hypothetical protein